MNDPWFRMHATVGSKRVVWRLMDFAKLDKARAVGHLAMFWGAVSQHCHGGVISDVPDVQIEEWAAWTGKRGVFAAFIRQQHSTDGVVNEYEEYSGALDNRREYDRQRKAAERERERADAAEVTRIVRGKSVGSHTDNPQDIPKMSAPTIRDDTSTTKTTTPDVSPKAASRRPGKAEPENPPSKSKPEPKYPHYPVELCQRLHAKWELEIGLIPYPAWRKRTAEVFNRPGFAESETPEIFEESIVVFWAMRDAEPEKERRWYTPERWWGDLPRLLDLARMPMVGPDGMPTAKYALAFAGH